jgi:arylsulfatase A-like enzyme
MKSLLLPARIFFYSAAAFVFARGALAESAPAKRPNIVVILSDDMGFSDLGCYGGEIATPNLDKLASNGVRFTQFYNTARCCPTRAALLTGLYSHQAGIGHMTEDKGLDGFSGELNKHCVTIAEALKPAGYRTYAVGKWHVCRNVLPTGDKHNWPLQRGFDRYYGTITGAGSYWDPGTLTRDNTALSAFADPEYQPAQYYYTDAIADQAIRFAGEHARDHANEPFFMYVAFTAAHWPLHAKESDIEKYRGRYDAGYDVIRRARFEKAKRLGVIEPNWDLSPTVWDWEKEANKAWEARCMEVYAAQIDCLDQNIGRILAALEKNGQIDNTLILFLQDNGACAEEINRKSKATRSDSPTLTPIATDAILSDVRPKQTRDGFPLLGGPGAMPGPRDTFQSYGEGWANASNTPFRLYKHFDHEGGISTPCIAHWPTGIGASRRNTIEKEQAHVIDIMATCVDLAGAKYPSEREGEKITSLQGVSLLPAFEGKPLGRKAPLFFEHEGNRAIRDGKWKLVAKNPGGKWELYDTEADRTEMHDISGQEPEKVRELAAKWETWGKSAGVLPWPWKPPYGETERTPN